jgi:hypothetical protein
MFFALNDARAGEEDQLIGIEESLEIDWHSEMFFKVLQAGIQHLFDPVEFGAPHRLH